VLWGEAVVPPYTFPPGCEIHVTQGDGTSNKKENDCESEDEDEDEVTPLSTQLNLTLHNCGDQVDEQHTFKNPIELRIIAKFLANEDLESCIGYVQEKDDDWKCQDIFDIFESSKNGAIYSTYVNHFTSFAVLLFPIDSGTGCGWSWITITSISLIASGIVLVILLAVIYVFSPIFRGFITGEDSLAIKKAQVFASRVADRQVVDEESFLSLTMPLANSSSYLSTMAVPTVITFGSDGGGAKQPPRTIFLSSNAPGGPTWS
jgi:hypothetical protein